jgi:hypothetical protein
VLHAHPDDDTLARAALSSVAQWARWAPTECATVLTSTLLDLSRTGRWRAALNPLVSTAAVLDDITPIADVTRRLLAALPEGPDAEADRDCPARQRLLALTEELCRRARQHPDLRDELGAVVDILAESFLARDLAVGLAAAAVAWTTDPMTDLAHLAELADTPGLALIAADQVADSLRLVVSTLPPRNLDQAVTAPSDDDSAPAAYIRLAVVAVAGDNADWPPQLRHALRTLRQHPDPDIARSALGVLTARE